MILKVTVFGVHLTVFYIYLNAITIQHIEMNCEDGKL